MASLNGNAAETRWGPRGTAGATIAARLAFEGIRHSYGGGASLDGVAFTVEPGEILCLLGRSGCGKTTLLRVTAGLERQSAGRITVNGLEIAGPRAFLAPEKRGIGLMFQDYALFPHLSNLRNVMFGLAGLKPAEAADVARRALARVGLEHHAEAFPHALSGGEQQRVALARAIAPRPSVLLMDEPFSNLDRRLRDQVREETLAVLRETRATAIIVTHDPEEAMRLGDRIALMRAGRLVQIGEARTLYETPADLFAARFFSELNEFEGRVSAGAVDTPLGRIAAPGRAEGETVVVAVRPQGVAVAPAGAGVPGRVIGHRFLGEVDQLDVAIDGTDIPVKARARITAPFAVGDEVGLSLTPRDVLVFAKDG
ncbi:ABC transporter ATP-binding protein [Prosthecomicrobium pneumaticum]|uniref:Iron(III) transport system ATP-binding protein n=1 Tax=Prosthecomicrobium pneumaticum TaxID=81895 RepID=A0A7W9FJ32_9HYPH|nr:ABC transporter ATP-binding protein [Prosthecomicrobium pneumaticum]MBB5751090.1 iron(III) transport system ATP-binding protein [Prosthecomicrobium pneumaticum]